MTLRFQHNANGYTNGQAIQPNYAAVGDAFTRLNAGDVGAGGAFRATTTDPFEGTASYEIETTSTGTVIFYDAWGTADAEYYDEFAIKVTTVPAANPTTLAAFFAEPAGSSAFTTQHTVVQMTGGTTSPRRMRIRHNSTDYSAGTQLGAGWYVIRTRLSAAAGNIVMTIHERANMNVVETVTAPLVAGTVTGSRRQGIATASSAGLIAIDNIRGASDAYLPRVDITTLAAGASWQTTTGFTMVPSGTTFLAGLSGSVAGAYAKSVDNPTSGQAVLSAFLPKLVLPSSGDLEVVLSEDVTNSVHASASVVATIYRDNALIKQRTFTIPSPVTDGKTSLLFPAADLTSVTADNWAAGNLMKIHLNFVAA